MRALLALTVAGALVIPGTTALAKPAPPKPDLVTSGVTATLSGTSLSVSATVTNKGKKKAKASTAAVYLSTDGTQGAGDVLAGTAAAPKLKPKAKATLTPTITISAPAGVYFVIVCADTTNAVKEKKESNNCAAGGSTVTVTSSTTPPPPPPNPVAVSASAGVGGTVAAESISGGSCTGTACTLSSGAGSVTFVPTPSGVNTFDAWTGATCTGFTSGAGNRITFTNATTGKSCTATFHEMVTISATAGPGGTVAAANVAGGSCTGTVCTMSKGASHVTFVPTAGANATFGSWSGCTGYSNGNGGEITFTDPTSAAACTVGFIQFVNVTLDNYLLWTTYSINGASGSSNAGSSVMVPKGSTVTITVHANAGFIWNGDWRSPDSPANLCDGTLGNIVSNTQTMTFSSISHDVHCQAHAHFPDGSG